MQKKVKSSKWRSAERSAKIVVCSLQFFFFLLATDHKYCKYLQFFFDASIIGQYVGISMFWRSNAYVGASGRPKAHASAHLRTVLVNPPQPPCSSDHRAVCHCHNSRCRYRRRRCSRRAAAKLLPTLRCHAATTAAASALLHLAAAVALCASAALCARRRGVVLPLPPQPPRS